MTLVLNLVERYWRAITLLVLLMITALSLMPLPELPALAGSDKSHHFIAYCALMLPAAIVRPPYWQGLALFFVLWSGAIELIQPFVNRYAEWLDLLANGCGILLAIVIAFGLRKVMSLQD